MSYFTLSNGERMYYEDTETGEQTIVMLHGLSTSHDIYAPCLTEIQKHARVITYDQRGHGKSKDANLDEVTIDTLANDLNELIAGLGLKDITLLGWSTGASVVLNYMEEFGCDALRQVVLCDMAPKQINDSDWHLGLYQGRYTMADAEKDEKRDTLSLFRSFATASVPMLGMMPAFLLNPILKKMMAESDENILRSLLLSLKDKDYRETVEKITVPLTYICAVPGSMYSPSLAGWYEEHVRTPYTSVPIENSTHMMIMDHPGEFAREVVKVLAR